MINNFKLGEDIFVGEVESKFKTLIPSLNPFSKSYIDFWRDEKRKCIDGEWFNNIYLPGILYFYINHWTIKVQQGKSEVKASPSLRDIEWLKGRIYMVARGFSGFELDTEYHCNNQYIDIEHPNNLKYLDPLTYLSRNFKSSLGKALFENQAKNVVEIGGRGYGKDLEENTTLYTPNGKVKIKDINIGDFIFGYDGNLTRVISKKEFTDQQQYKVTLADGRSLECGGGHLWGVVSNSKFIEEGLYAEEYYVLETIELIKNPTKYKIPVKKSPESRFSRFIHIKSIEPTEIKPSICIGVDNDLKLFVAGEDYIVTHNSYFSGACLAYNFLFDGATNYEEYLKAKNTMSAVIMVGAIDYTYSNKLVDKVKIGFDNMKGDVEFGKKLYRCPLKKTTEGSLTSGNKTLTAVSKVNRGGVWENKGSNSQVIHVSFGDNPEAANGNRITFAALEEIGFMGNLLPTLGNLVDCTTVDGNKFGTIWMFGTGGDMDGGSTQAVQSVFNDPEAYDCIAFEDTFEYKSNKIGLFIPAYYKYNKYRDEKGVVNRDSGLQDILKTRNRLAKADSKEPLNRELQNNPLIPSDAFLVTEGNVFPIAELKEHLAYLESIHSIKAEVSGTIGELSLESSTEVKFIPDLTNRLKPCGFPIKEKDDKTGCLVIWKHPRPNAGYGTYVAGTDTYDQDQANNTVSVGSTFILERATIDGTTHDQLVAEYTARPGTANEHHENVRKLLMYYKAVDLYENERNSIKMHFEHKNSLHLLMSEPTILKSIADTNVSRKYGIHMTKFIKQELEIYTRDWLMEPVEGGRLNLHYIYSIPLLKELISYNNEGNFDRVIAFMLTICAKLQFAKIQSKSTEDSSKKDFFKFFSRKLYSN